MIFFILLFTFYFTGDEEIFSPNDVVEGIFIIRDDMKQRRGCGFVKFPNRDMVVAAISNQCTKWKLRDEDCDFWFF